MESPQSPFDGICSLMLLLRRSQPESTSRPHTSYGLSKSRSGSSSPPPSDLAPSRPGHPADSFARTPDRSMRRRSKWLWTGRNTDDADGNGAPEQDDARGRKPRRPRLTTAWTSPSALSHERDTYMSERALSRHTRAMDRKLPRIHEADAALDDEEGHDADLRREGICDPDDITSSKRGRALAALERDLPLRRNSDMYDAVLVQAELSIGMRRDSWGEAWSPL